MPINDASSPSHQAPPDWRADVFRVLKEHAVKHVAYVPDAGHSTAIRLAEADNEISTVVPTTEEEGIGHLAAAWLCRARCVADAVQRRRQLYQHAGAADGGDHAGRLGGVESVAESDGQATEAALKLMGVLTWRADDPADVAPLLHGAASMAFNDDCVCALLLGQRLIGEKKWVQ